MNNKIIKSVIVKRVVDKLKETKITIGGNKVFYKKRYNLKYTQVIVDNVINAFMEVIVEGLENGDSISLNSYMTLEPKYYSGRTARNVHSNTEVKMPAQYRVKFHSGSRLKDACKRFTERKLTNNNDD